MADVHDAATRSRNMAAIKASDTRPEMLVRKALHAQGLRYRLHVRDLPGNPDIVFPRHRAIVFVNGCFFHGHNCHLFKWPEKNAQFWRDKIGRNIERDRASRKALQSLGWRTADVWECALKGRTRLDFGKAMDALGAWVCSKQPHAELKGEVA